MKRMLNFVIRSIDIISKSKQGIQLLTQILKLMEHIRTDEEMQENIIWLVNAMVEQGENVVDVCIENQVVALITNQLTPDKLERVITHFSGDKSILDSSAST
jgi:hypothetical protein